MGGISLLLVEKEMKGIERRKMRTQGWASRCVCVSMCVTEQDEIEDVEISKLIFFFLSLFLPFPSLI